MIIADDNTLLYIVLSAVGMALAAVGRAGWKFATSFSGEALMEFKGLRKDLRANTGEVQGMREDVRENTGVLSKLVDRHNTDVEVTQLPKKEELEQRRRGSAEG